MQPAPIPDDEAFRLQSLHDLQVLDTPAEPDMDALVRVAALVCQVPISLISLVDSDRQWFLARQGLDISQIPRDISFCGHAIATDVLFEVPDALQDERFADNPLVVGAPDIRFYAGAPLRLSNGARVGTLCVIDQQSHELSPMQRDVLQLLAQAAARALEGQRAIQAERRLREQAIAARQEAASSEARYRALSAASPLGVFMTDAEGRCIYTNSRWRDIYGLSLADSLGDGWGQVLHPDDRQRVVDEWLRSAQEGVEFDSQFRLCPPGAPVRHVHSRARAVLDETGQVSGYVGTVEDISSSKQVEQALNEEREHMRSVLEGTDAGTWEWNVATGQARFNERWAAMLGYTLAELDPLGIERWTGLMHPDDLARARDLLQEHFCGASERYECEFRMRHRDGHWVWVQSRGRVLSRLADGKPEWMFGTHLDVTARVEQQQQLERANERIALAADSGGIGIWELDLASGALVWDGWMYRLHGMSPLEQPGTRDDWLARVHAQDREATAAALQRAISGRRSFDTEFRVLLAGGGARYLRAAGRVVHDPQGEAERMVGVCWDVSHLRELGVQLSRQHDLMRVTLQSIGDAVITTDADGAVSWVNPVAERLTGWKNEDAVGLPVDAVCRLIDENTRQPLPAPVRQCLEPGGQAGEQHAILLARDGREFGIEDTATPIRTEGGELLGAVMVFRDVTEQRRIHGEINWRATHDPLTGLFNRGEFEQRLQRALQRAHEDDSRHALLYIDLDRFKPINDTCGHAAGDLLLQQISRVLGESVRSADTLARLGGDEFAVLLDRCSLEQGLRVAEKICQRVAAFAFVVDEQVFHIGASIGLAPLDARWTTLEDVMAAADSSCYAAKQSGRSQVCQWQPDASVPPVYSRDKQLRELLEQALRGPGFELYAQRVVALAPGKSGLHAEVLLRLRGDAPDELLLPGVFMPVAERHHLSARIDRWVIRRTLDWLQAMPDLALISTLSLNISAQAAGDRAFHRQVAEMLAQAGPDLCRRLCFEIGEFTAVSNPVDVRAFIELTRGLGVRIALDDFGSGSTSFAYLKSVAVDVLKIDGQFVRDMLDDPLDAAAVRCFIDVAAVVGVTTVAKLVERPEVIEQLRLAGVDLVQGVQLHPPQPLASLL